MTKRLSTEEALAVLYDEDGNERTQVDMAARLGVTIPTVRRALLGHGSARRPSSNAKATADIKTVAAAITRHVETHMWAPSQRELANETGLTLQRVNYVLHMMAAQGLIELGQNPREIRVVGAKMILPEWTL